MDAKRRPVLDPTVADLLGDMQRREAERALTPADRRKRQTERERARGRSRVMYDLPPDMIAWIKEQSAALDCPESQVAAALIRHGMTAVEDGDLRLEDYRQPARGLRHTWRLAAERQE
jgi:hypothetical protein